MWGGGEKGQLGTGEDLNYSLPVLVDALQAKQSTAQQSKAVKPRYSLVQPSTDALVADQQSRRAYSAPIAVRNCS